MSKKPKIYPVILCGGSGKRLWPVSRQAYPKQFVPFVEGQSLFEATLARVTGPDFAPVMSITGNDFRFIVAAQQLQAGCSDGIILIEPQGRNTAPAILAAAQVIAQSDPDGIILVLPSDHIHQDEAAFLQAVRVAADSAAKGAMVTFGVKPTRPETGFGYIELETPLEDGAVDAQDFEQFVEKPDVDTAKDMLKTGRFLWNSGMFCFSAQSILQAFAKHAPDVVAPVSKAVEEKNADLDFIRLSDAYNDSPDISIDYAIMEHVTGGKLVPIDSGWNDLGSWKTVWQESNPDSAGVATTGNALSIECENTLLRSDEPEIGLVGIGLKNIIAVATRDAVLVADMDRTQDVKIAVEQLKEFGAKQATEFPRCYRPWGWYETLSLGARFQVKRIMVKPGAKLSLQSHVHRAEHWVVVTGAALVTVGKDESLLGENQSTYIPLGAVHRLENPGKVDLHLIEVQSGAYLGEDDIVRYEDIYARV
ncbi:MAG: mannose-1-phosphate guanylyltransferase/mannose-6-phosphate isomerase [Paracoccaceae bacterium]